MNTNHHCNREKLISIIAIIYMSPGNRDKNKNSCYGKMCQRFLSFFFLYPKNKDQKARHKKISRVSFLYVCSFFASSTISLLMFFVLNIIFGFFFSLSLSPSFTILDLCISPTTIHLFIHQCAFLFALSYRVTNRNNK